MSSRFAFTLIDTLIAVAILAVLAGILVPRVGKVIGLGETAAMAATVNQVRNTIRLQASVGDAELSKEGFPEQIEESWFRGQLPQSVWTGEAFNIQVVHGPKNARSPNKKTFNPNANAHTAWYNAANGSFCALVPKGKVPDEGALFEEVNGYLE